MSDKKQPQHDDDDEHTDAIVAADATGMVANEIFLTDVQLLEGENPPAEPQRLVRPVS